MGISSRKLLKRVASENDIAKASIHSISDYEEDCIHAASNMTDVNSSITCLSGPFPLPLSYFWQPILYRPPLQPSAHDVCALVIMGT